MPEKTQPSAPLLFLAFLALRKKAILRSKKTGRALAGAARTLAQPIVHPVASVLSLAAFSAHCAQGVASFFRRPRWIWIPIGCLTAHALLSVAFFVATGPQGLPGLPSFSAFATKRLAPESFFGLKADMRAGVCENGSIGRIGSTGCTKPSEVLGDARALFSVAAQIYARQPASMSAMSARPPLSASARGAIAPGKTIDPFQSGARQLARQLSQRRGAATLDFMLGGLGPLLSFFLFLTGVSWSWRLLHPSTRVFWRTKLGNEWSAMTVGALFLAALTGGQALVAVSVFGAQRQAAWPWLQTQATVHSPAFFGPMDFSGSRELALRVDPYSKPWETTPNNLTVERARLNDSNPAPLLGAWSLQEIVSPRAPELLRSRAPRLTDEQRAAALAYFSATRDQAGRLYLIFDRCVMPAAALIMSLLALVALVFGGRWLFKSTLQKGKSQLVRLAVEGAQESLAQHEAQTIGRALRGDEASRSTDGAPPRPPKRASRL